MPLKAAVIADWARLVQYEMYGNAAALCADASPAQLGSWLSHKGIRFGIVKITFVCWESAW